MDVGVCVRWLVCLCMYVCVFVHVCVSVCMYVDTRTCNMYVRLNANLINISIKLFGAAGK